MDYMGMSPSSRRAGIEIQQNRKKDQGNQVALLAEGGDRNCAGEYGEQTGRRVALLAEGGDRNSYVAGYVTKKVESPSSRRAGIEIEGC